MGPVKRRANNRPRSGRASEEGFLMAFSGQVLHNPVSGERFVFHTTAGDSAGGMSIPVSRKASRCVRGS